MLSDASVAARQGAGPVKATGKSCVCRAVLLNHPLMAAWSHGPHLGVHMSLELETLDQLCGGDLPIAVVRGLFADSDRFVHAIMAMLSAGEIRLVDADDAVVPRWRWRDILCASATDVRLSITDTGARRIT
jgi:hypothetical protein